MCDLNISAKELLRCKSYDLGALVEKCLGEGEEDKRSLLTPDSLRFVSPPPLLSYYGSGYSTLPRILNSVLRI